ncbi:DinB superfamily protein [Posidoniimonas polymericola]|uniref:DinB superfamily protein n=1 Tax=Posidoniimonas polymericola TaxID=2528002 RepID=A0A5C5YT84_9BACT|nr:DinB family protein [Posidoniimonas polymericola]TWT77867.1 DinB superfamily protein [Posidoniimonas polymericola]
MNPLTNQPWIDALRGTVDSYRRMIDATVTQLSDAELRTRPAPGMNSVATILRHLGGNLQSRWTDFLTTDGEKPDRDRESEFLDWPGDRESLMAYFDAGWAALTSAISQLDDNNLGRTITIRGEPHTIPEALMRSVTHLTYHVGQISLIARTVHEGDWHWLTIAPGQSAEHNDRSWGTSESRGVFGKEEGGP